jgi:adenine specific DNA methylase Mod
MTNQLFYGDNLYVLREHIASESVDLVYLDPPFNSNAKYNILWPLRREQKKNFTAETACVLLG